MDLNLQARPNLIYNSCHKIVNWSKIYQKYSFNILFCCQKLHKVFQTQYIEEKYSNFQNFLILFYSKLYHDEFLNMVTNLQCFWFFHYFKIQLYFIPQIFYNYLPFIYVQNIYMNPLTIIYPKNICSSTHSIRNSLKPYNQSAQKKWVLPFVKLKNIFTKKPRGKKHQKNFSQTQSCLHNKTNISYINLGIDQDQYGAHLNPKSNFPNPPKIKQASTQINNKSFLNFVSQQKPKKSKRNRHLSLVNMIENQTLFTLNRQKQKKFDNKFINSLCKKEMTEKTNLIEFTHGLRLISYSNNQFNIQTSPNRLTSKSKQQEKWSSSKKGSDEPKVLDLKPQNYQKLPSNFYVLNSLNTKKSVDKCKKKLSRRYLKQNTTVHTVEPLFRTGQNSQLSKSKIIQQGQQKQNEQIKVKKNYQSICFVKPKFNLAKLIKTLDQRHQLDKQVQDQGLKQESANKKYKKLLRSRIQYPSKDNNLMLTPWESVISENEIGINF